MLDATRKLYFSYQGVVLDTREVPAHDIQLRAAIELARMHGLYPKNGNGEVEPHDPPGSSFTLVINEPGRARQIGERLASRLSRDPEFGIGVPGDEEPR
jgi:hypothetical protein